MSERLGRDFAQAVAARDFDALVNLFVEDGVFIAATPGYTWHAHGRPEIAEALSELFPDDERIDHLLALRHHDIPGRWRMSYRMRGESSAFGPFEYEHQVYYSTVRNRIQRLRILCSGLYTPPG